MHEQDERRQAATPRDRDARAASGDHQDDEHPHAASGGERYQTAHREHAVEQQGPATSRSARGTGPSVRRSQAPSADVHAGQSSDPSGPAGSYPAERAADVATVRPHPDDEAQLTDQGYPKLGRHLQSRTTQHEHGPNAGGTQQGDAASPRPERQQ